MRVRKLPKILDTPEALRLLEINGFDAAEEFLAKKDPKEQELYLMLERTRVRLSEMTIGELVEARDSKARLEILRALRAELDTVLENVERVPRAKAARKVAAG
jgi:predicted nucleic acid-binding protein